MSDHAPAVVGPVYLRGAVPAGPFDDPPPLDLWRLFSAAGARSGDEARACSRAWLVDALEDAGVVLAGHDRAVVEMLADDCASTVQVIAGWIAQARRTRSGAAPSSR